MFRVLRCCAVDVVAYTPSPFFSPAAELNWIHRGVKRISFPEFIARLPTNETINQSKEDDFENELHLEGIRRYRVKILP